jgi:hypothetical protein
MAHISTGALTVRVKNPTPEPEPDPENKKPPRRVSFSGLSNNRALRELAKRCASGVHTLVGDRCLLCREPACSLGLADHTDYSGGMVTCGHCRRYQCIGSNCDSWDVHKTPKSHALAGNAGYYCRPCYMARRSPRDPQASPSPVGFSPQHADRPTCNLGAMLDGLAQHLPSLKKPQVSDDPPDRKKRRVQSE